ncbi:MAG: primosomal protein N' [Lewinellaceae bacterium]|nr:primosomal protein N' [Lewinellaceae bacterium]
MKDTLGTNALYTTNHFAEVILPIAIPKPYSYWVPEELLDQVVPGKRVEVQFGRRKLYAGIVLRVGPVDEIPYRAKPILSVLDEAPIVTDIHLQFWQWIADYYLCTIGEVMHAALPASLKLTSETTILLHPDFEDHFEDLDDQEYLIAEALTIRHELSLEDVQGILQIKTIYPIINRLLVKGVLLIKEELQDGYKPKTVDIIQLADAFVTDTNAAFELTARAPKQTETLLHFYQLFREKGRVTREDFHQHPEMQANLIPALVKKGILEIVPEEVSRLKRNESPQNELPALTGQQIEALDAIHAHWEYHYPILLYGITGSGKTRVYIELAREMLASGKQILYLLPEIALTTQVIERLRRIFGNQIIVSHSKLSSAERVEVWKAVLSGQGMVVGARSALFLPFNNLGLIVVDEEHDSSFKQADPAPRYNARDAALVLSRMQRAKIILGSATPSFESYYNAQKDKYKLVHMPERVGDAVLPVTEVVDLKAFQRKRQMKHEFSPPLLAAIESTIQKGKQVILFQNRRGFSPYLHCKICDFHAQCVHCDVSLTYHKYFNKLVCHYCSYQTDIPKYCPDCGSDQLELKGFGTEKIEENLRILMPALRIGRMDLDTVKTVKAQEKILQDLELKRLDVVIGTQMVTKGLDFPGIGLVAILQVDQMLHYPDYRANERAYQLITQVSGRAGRKDSQGQVILQTYQPEHPVIQDVLKNHYQSFYAYEMLERKKFGYPPYTRQVLLVLKHKTAKTVFEGGKWLTRRLREKLPERVKGPSEPTVARVRNQYVRHVLITLDKRLEHLQQVKDFIENSISDLKAEEGFSTIRVNVDVDPY